MMVNNILCFRFKIFSIQIKILNIVVMSYFEIRLPKGNITKVCTVHIVRSLVDISLETADHNIDILTAVTNISICIQILYIYIYIFIH